MADEIDRANDVAQNRLEGIIAGQRAALAQIGTPECDDCGEDIPPARRAAYPAATRCVHCQGRFEARRRQGVNG